MNNFSLLVEILVALVMAILVLRMLISGRRELFSHERGWPQIFGGFCLLLFGALVDISDHFPELSRFLILGQTPYQAVAEKLVGFLGGFTLLAIGFWRWLPQVSERRRTEEELRQTTEELEHRVRKGSAELNLNKLDLEREIRQRRMATSELRRSRELLEKVVGSAPIALLASDAGGEISLAKGRSLPAVGVERDDEYGGTSFEPYPQVANSLQRALAGEKSISTLVIEDRTFEFLHSPWISEEEEVQGVITVGTDVTELHQAHEALRQAKEVAEEANRSKSQFLANMSHELRTPLNSVIGFANVLRKNKGQRLNDQDLRYLDRIQDNGQHLLTLINEILDLSRIESGHQELDWEEVDLQALVRDTVSHLRTARDGRVPIRKSLAKGAATVRADAVKLRQVLLNLLSNAVKFTQTGQVELRSQVDEDGRPLRLEITDTGPGIPEASLEQIFQPFQQAHDEQPGTHGGSGLGLTISRSLCRQMGFDLKVTSRVGVGSTFWIDFQPDVAPVEVPAHGFEELETVDRPLSTPLPQEPQPEVPLAHLEGRRILLIDDNAEARLLLMEMLHDLHCEVLIAASGEEGLALARESRPELIILDLLMPDMDGWQVLATLKNDPSLFSVPVLVASIIAEEKRGSLVGALEVLNKPISRHQLEGVLTRLVSLRPGRILVVDDEEMIRHLLFELLSRQGYEVQTADGVDQALTTLETFDAELMVVDLVMPGIGGRGLIAALRSAVKWRDLPILVVTGMVLKETERQELESQVAAIIHKGLSLEEDLRRSVSQLIGD